MATAQLAIREIVDDTLDRFDPDGFWPPHPLDEAAGETSTSLYFGAAGVLWALDHLRRAGAAEFGQDFRGLLPRLLTLNREEHAANPYPQHASLLCGDVGVLLLMARLAPAPTIADDLFERAAANNGLPVLELLWGTAGTMLACVAMAELTGEERWWDAYRVQARRLLDDLAPSEFGPLWTQDLYGRSARYLGLGHGYAGNMLALLRGWRWLADEQQARLADIIPQTLAATAADSEAGVNWPAVATAEPPSYLVQICHGAPGMIAAFADCPFSTPDLERLLRRGGDLVWQAGPLAKGSNFCHGTAGNGYAFLKLYKRTGHPMWLDRARAFAMAAIAQCRKARRQYGQGRYSLWTGDLGLAFYLWDCASVEARFPTVDAF
ncbi:MAG: lanthionine synthetase C family protein [Dongiaceae bacterium]